MKIWKAILTLRTNLENQWQLFFKFEEQECDYKFNDETQY